LLARKSTWFSHSPYNVPRGIRSSRTGPPDDRLRRSDWRIWIGAKSRREIADNLTPVVYSRGLGADANRTDVNHPFRGRPRERMVRSVASSFAKADDLTTIIQRRRGTETAAKGTEVDESV
jgi:hypothetical protein